MLRLLIVSTFALTGLPGAFLEAEDDPRVLTCRFCGRSGEPCRFTTRTIKVPMRITEYRMKTCTIEEAEEREEKYTVFKRESQEITRSKECCYLQPEFRQQEVTEKHCVVVNLPVESVRKVYVPVTETASGDDCCPKCGETSRCRHRTVFLGVTEQTEERTQRVVVFPQTERVVDYFRLTPKKQTVEHTKETHHTLTPDTRTRTVTVGVKKLVQQPVEVTVCREVSQEVAMCEVCARKHDSKASSATSSRSKPSPKYGGKPPFVRLCEKLGVVSSASAANGAP